MNTISTPRFSPRWWVTLPWTAKDIYRRLTPPDPALHATSYWWHGGLARKRIEDLAESVSRTDIAIVNPGLRDPGTSVTLLELVGILMLMATAKATQVLEIGTYDGNTALNMAVNLPPVGRVVTVDLPLTTNGDLALSIDNATERNMTDRTRVGEQFIDHPHQQKITQILCDSALLDFSSLGGPFDFAFIDGCHAYSYVKSDTENVMRVMRPGGMVVWHDYAMMESVSRAVDEFRNAFQSLCAVQSTRLAVGIMK